ncbi:MAG: alpha-galactosidase [Bacillota bacterium]|nr:alpha-galactosidase [Bacillota bacterium]
MKHLTDILSISRTDDFVRFDRIFGFVLARDSNPRAEGGMIRLWADDRVTNTDYIPGELALKDDSLAVVWHANELDIKTTVAYDPVSSVLVWKTAIVNTSKKAVTIRRAASRFAFPEGDGWSLYTQEAGWSRENRGSWTRFGAGELSIGSAFGRTTRYSAPFAVLRDDESGMMLSAHMLPNGDWRMALSAHADADAVLTLGMTDQLAYLLVPDAALELPEVWLFEAEGVDFSAYKLHRHYIRSLDHSPFTEPPVAYNTWFYEFPILNIGRLREQLVAAKEIGCEIFVIDAGWYGLSTGEAWNDQGDWREKTEYAFHGQMRAFADEVREAGLTFGLWCEAEAVMPKTPVCKEHPTWFVSNGKGYCHFDLTNPEAYAYLFDLICHLHDRYGLAWMKFDFNAEQYAGADGHYAYLKRWYNLLEDVRKNYPDFYLEGCASGAMRTELSSLQHYDGFFLSDNVNPYDVLHISEGAFLRLPPGYLERWCTVRSVSGVPDYGKAGHESAARTLVPEGAVWERCGTCDISFPLTLGVMGILAFAGDIAHFDQAQKQAAIEAVQFYKQYRRMLRSAWALLLTKPAAFSCRNRWSAIQLTDGNTNLVYAYRTASRTSHFLIRPRQLDPDRIYTVKKVLPAGETIGSFPGAALMNDGIIVSHPVLDYAAVYLIV